MIDVGIWGPGPHESYGGDDWYDRVVEDHRRLEKKISELDGYKALYATCYHTEDEFWGIYDRLEYEMLRSKYRVEKLPDVYSKVKRPLGPPQETSRICGAMKMLLGGEHLVEARRKAKTKPQIRHGGKWAQDICCLRPLS